MIKLRLYIFYQNMIYSKNEAIRDTSHHDVKYHEKLRSLNKSY